MYPRGSKTRQALRCVALSASLTSIVPKACRWQKGKNAAGAAPLQFTGAHSASAGDPNSTVAAGIPVALFSYFSSHRPWPLVCHYQVFQLRILLGFGECWISVLRFWFVCFILIIISLKCCFSLFRNPGRVTGIHFVITATVSSLPKVFPWFLIIKRQKLTVSPWPNRCAHGVLSVLQMLQNLAEPPYGDLEYFPDSRTCLCHRERQAITQSPLYEWGEKKMGFWGGHLRTLY